jgi:hypothetical protein
MSKFACQCQKTEYFFLANILNNSKFGPRHSFTHKSGNNTDKEKEKQI